MPNSVRKVYPEYHRCRPADGGLADKVRALPAKMAAPLVAAGMKESRDVIAVRVNACEIGSLEGIARKAGKSKVLGNSGTTVTVGDDMVNFEIDVVVLLSHPAILASGVRSAPDKSPQFRIHAFSLR